MLGSLPNYKHLHTVLTKSSLAVRARRQTQHRRQLPNCVKLAIELGMPGMSREGKGQTLGGKEPRLRAAEGDIGVSMLIK